MLYSLTLVAQRKYCMTRGRQVLLSPITASRHSSKLNYGNTTHAGLPDCSLKRLQSVINATWYSSGILGEEA